MDRGLKTSDYWYDLPEELIAQTPLAQRDHSRLMVVPKQGQFEHKIFTDIEDYLLPGDVLSSMKRRFCRQDCSALGKVQVHILRCSC